MLKNALSWGINPEIVPDNRSRPTPTQGGSSTVVWLWLADEWWHSLISLNMTSMGRSMSYSTTLNNYYIVFINLRAMLSDPLRHTCHSCAISFHPTHCPIISLHLLSTSTPCYIYITHFFLKINKLH